MTISAEVYKFTDLFRYAQFGSFPRTPTNAALERKDSGKADCIINV